MYSSSYHCGPAYFRSEANENQCLDVNVTDMEENLTLLFHKTITLQIKCVTPYT